MNPILRNILAVVVGAILGSVVNMGFIMVSGSIIPPPDGADVTTMEGLKASMHLFQPKHFIFPFLAHAFGAFVGAFIAAKMAIRQKMIYAMGIGVFFLIGGITNIFMLPSPIWFTVLDLVVAYIPMAYIAGKFADKQ
ncbi:MAG: hypothetical protein IPL31_02900 [Saprospiraceae bacterium]|nr:hypothetical protein [Saprospiraceae bacterium]